MTALQQLAQVGIQPKRLVSDSRRVQAGDVFLAYRGEQADGRDHIGQAVANGASAVLWDDNGFAWNQGWQLPHVAVEHLREQVGEIASEFHGHPSRRLWMIGITGTNGKTSCSHWLAQALTRIGRKTALVGTLGNGFPGTLSEAINTTPDPILLHGMLADYLTNGAAAVAMEVSSHGLSQGRVNGVHFDVAVFTNLTRDHLDYHGDMAAYAAAKQQLFDWPGLGCAVLNADDDFGADLARELTQKNIKVLTYGLCAGDVRGSDLVLDEKGLVVQLEAPQGAAALRLPLFGRFNAYNLLAVLATLLASGIELDDAVQALRELRPVAGRMQLLGGGKQPTVVVDYAHTPDALEKVLASLREQTRGRLICVFGCGGNRDKGKRPLMGGAASRLADAVVVTSDNPRHEDARKIIADIVAGMGGNYHVEEDRAAAIEEAIQDARAGDVVLVAGKGHETYQQIGDDKLPFSDAEVAQRALGGQA
ncbi:MAG TPA: UDP-N-acetylmuramoyl-L-alanyl-D-glutamate--2,6-diaminopimelate ligase [Methylophilaceae bacterium]|nr:UDP-N-acetylmuramoyl-L-alanyl-D-glutamate--2,6-diaminopimelate ligase [Methylophilaceae bacterium]